jgi:aromatic ring-opening dioxygenase catalytic subunit (LigB family)
MTGERRRRFEKLESSLKEFRRQLAEKPEALLVVSGHWEDKDFAVMASPSPPMVYDYRGFPVRRMADTRGGTLKAPPITATTC